MVEQRSEEPRVASSILALGTKRSFPTGGIFCLRYNLFMKRKEEQVIIIGGGMAGIGAARTLKVRGIPFVMISPDVGGDVVSDRGANLGAYLLTPSAQKLMPFLKPEKRVWFGNTVVGSRPLYRGMLSPALLPLWHRFRKFRKEWDGFHRDVMRLGETEAFAKRPFLRKLWGRSSAAFAKNEGERKWLRDVVDPVVRMCTLAEVDQLSAFEYGHIAMHIDVPVHTFTFDAAMACYGWDRQIVRDRVNAVRKTKEGWSVQTGRHGVFRASRVIVAVGTHTAKAISGLPRRSTVPMAAATVWHLTGSVSLTHPSNLHVFLKNHPLYFLHQQEDGTYIVATKKDALPPTSIFRTEKILFQKRWKRAFPVGKRVWAPQKWKSGLCAIDDRDVVGMEDAYRTGVWAAESVEMN